MDTSCGPATNDFYGKMYNHILSHFTSLRTKLKTKQVTFRIMNVNALELPTTLKETTFDRIEVSNISDKVYIGLKHTLETFGPLLQSQTINPYATLITLFVNAISVITRPDSKETCERYMARAARYFPLAHTAQAGDALSTKISTAKDVFRDFEGEFDKYMRVVDFKRIQEERRLVMKEKHTVSEKWPMRLKLRPGEKGAKEEFEVKFSSGHTGMERYVEWKVKQ